MSVRELLRATESVSGRPGIWPQVVILQNRYFKHSVPASKRQISLEINDNADVYTEVREKKGVIFWGRPEKASPGSPVSSLAFANLTLGGRESLMVVISYLLDLSLLGRGAGSRVLFLFPFL